MLTNQSRYRAIYFRLIAILFSKKTTRVMALFYGCVILLVAAGCGEKMPTGLEKPAAEKASPLQKPDLGVVPISSSMHMAAQSSLFGGTPITVTDTDIDQQGETLNDLSVSVSAFAENGNESVLTTGAGMARWRNAAQGEVELSNIGWETMNVPNGGAEIGGENWVYRFTADENGVFTLDYSVTASGSNLFGLSGFIFDWPDSDPHVLLKVNSNGTLTRQVVQGQTYTVIIHSLSNIFVNLGTRNALMNGKFFWHITPEEAPKS